MRKMIQLEFILIDARDIGIYDKIWYGLSPDKNTYKINHINGIPVDDFIHEHGTTRYSGYLSSSNAEGWYDFRTEV